MTNARRAACVLIALGLVVVIHAAPARGDLMAIAAKADCYTAHTYATEAIEFNRRTLGGAYREVGKRDPKWDDAALALLDAAAINFAYSERGQLYQPKEYPSVAKCAELARSAIDKGCDDPLVLYLQARFLEVGGRTSREERREEFRRAYDALRESKYPAMRLYSAASLAMAYAPEDQREELDEARKRYLLQAVAGPFLNAAHRRTVYSYTWEPFEDAPVDETLTFYQRLKDTKDADPWIVNVFGGNYHIDAAWNARGSGVANTVTQAGWRGFFRNLAEAEKCLNAAWKLRPDHPEGPTLMITVAMGGGNRVAGTERDWFDRAVAAQFDYRDAYSRLYNALLPRWGGSHEKILEVGLEAARTERYDTDVPYQLIDAMEEIRRDARDPSLWNVPEAYAAATKVLDTYAQRYADHALGPWFTSFHAALAWRLGKYDEARGLLDRLGAKVELERFTYLGGRPTSVAEVYARTGPYAADLTKAHQFLRDRKPKEALALLREIEAKADDADKGKPYLKERVEFVDRGFRFESGEWVSLVPSAEHLARNPSENGIWRLDERGRLVGTSKGTGVYLPSDFNTGPRYEVSVTIARGEDPAQRLPEAVVWFNYDHTNTGDNLALNLNYRREKAELIVYGQRYRELAGKLGDEVTVNVRCYDGQSLVTVEGLEGTMRHRRPSDAHKPATSITAIGCMDSKVKGTLYVTEWKIRRLDKSPTAAAAAADGAQDDDDVDDGGEEE